MCLHIRHQAQPLTPLANHQSGAVTFIGWGDNSQGGGYGGNAGNNGNGGNNGNSGNNGNGTPQGPQNKAAQAACIAKCKDKCSAELVPGSEKWKACNNRCGRTCRIR